MPQSGVGWKRSPSPVTSVSEDEKDEVRGSGRYEGSFGMEKRNGIESTNDIWRVRNGS